MLAALSADYPARENLQGMSDWTDLLMGHYENLIAAWRARMNTR